MNATLLKSHPAPYFDLFHVFFRSTPRIGFLVRLLILAGCFGSMPMGLAANPSEDAGPWLVFHTGIAQTSSPHNGTLFAVDVDDGSQTKTVYRTIWGESAWLPQAVNLSEFAGRSVLIRLKTLGVYNTAKDCNALWGDPMIVTGPLVSAQPSLMLLDLPISRNFAGNVDAPISLDEDAEVEAGLKMERLQHPPSALAYGPHIPAFFIFPWYTDQHRWHQVEFHVDLPARPVAAPVASGSKPSTPALKNVAFRVEDAVTIAHPEWGIRADIDKEKMSMGVSMGPAREAGLTYGYAFSGFQVVGLTKALLEFRLSPSFPVPLSPANENSFAGIILDYHTPDGWSRRVFLNSLGIEPSDNVPPGRTERRAPNWNLDLEMVSVTGEIDREILYETLEFPTNADSSIVLPIAKYAPANWDGGLWLAIGVQEVEAETTIEAKILKANP
jgi:hypothetical protein